MKGPFLELKPTYLELKHEFDAAYHRVMDSGWYLHGRELEAFEADFAAYCEVKHCVGVGNGLDALHLILRAWGIGPGREVIVPSNTFIATWLAVSYAGATPVPVEPDPQTYNLDPNRIEAAITPRTRAIMPVHLYGQPADMDPITALAARHGLKVLEDNAQAQGARSTRGVAQAGWATRPVRAFIPGRTLAPLPTRAPSRPTMTIWRTGSARCGTMARRRSITTTSKASTPGWMNSRRPSCG